MKKTSAKAPVPAATRKALIATGAGNAAEWFDWAIYATFSSYIAKALFSSADPASAFLQTLAIFAVGFIARPVGGWLFGMLGDRAGRKQAMLFSVGLGALGSLIIGLTPGYESLGAAASAILLAARILQGLAHGGELPSAQTYLSEIAPNERRGLFSSLIYVSGTIGTVGGVLIGALLSTLMSAQDMTSFGWRIPFILGGILGALTLLLRSRMHESDLFEEVKHEEKPTVLQALSGHWKQAGQIIGLTAGVTVAYYVWSVAMPAYAISVLGMGASGALWAGVIGNVVMILLLPLWGRLSDSIGRRPVLMIGAFGAALLHFPSMFIMGSNLITLTLATTLMLVFVGAMTAIVPAVYAELLPTQVRTVGVAIPYAICVALFGGTAPYLQAAIRGWFPEAGMLFDGYVVLLLLVSGAFAWSMQESKGKDLR